MIWSSLTHIQQNHPSPSSDYAREVGDMFRERIITKFGGHQNCSTSFSSQQLPSPPTQPYWGLLNFASHAEYEQFYHARKELQAQQDQLVAGTNGGGNRNSKPTSSLSHGSENDHPSLTQVIAFLESTPWNVES